MLAASAARYIKDASPAEPSTRFQRVVYHGSCGAELSFMLDYTHCAVSCTLDSGRLPGTVGSY